MRSKTHPKTGQRLSRHHITPKSRRGDIHNVNEVEHVLYLWRNRHDSWHFLFKNMTLDEIIETLTRVKRIKK